jgi:hypothetical protein
MLCGAAIVAPAVLVAPGMTAQAQGVTAGNASTSGRTSRARRDAYRLHAGPCWGATGGHRGGAATRRSFRDPVAERGSDPTVKRGAELIGPGPPTKPLCAAVDRI